MFIFLLIQAGFCQLDNTILQNGFSHLVTGGGMGTLTGWQRIAADVLSKLEQDGGYSDLLGTAVKTIRVSSDEQEQLQQMQNNRRLQSVLMMPGASFYMQYQLLEVIGKGAYGRAMKARSREESSIVVVKEIITEGLSENEMTEARGEIKVLAYLDHPHIVRYFNAYSEPDRLLIVMEYCEEGELTSYLKRRDGKLLDEDEIMLKFVQICLGLHHTHEMDILHRDLKTNNVFCQAFGIVKLGDFGISRVIDSDTQMAKTMVGTPSYLSPEICHDKLYGKKSDIWSLGCILYELCTLKRAFDGRSLPGVVVKIISGKYDPIPDHYSYNLKQLVSSLLQKDQNMRPSIGEILELEYVQQYLYRYAQHVRYFVEYNRDKILKSLQQFLNEFQMEDLGQTSDIFLNQSAVKLQSISEEEVLDGEKHNGVDIVNEFYLRKGGRRTSLLQSVQDEIDSYKEQKKEESQEQ